MLSKLVDEELNQTLRHLKGIAQSLTQGEMEPVAAQDALRDLRLEIAPLGQALRAWEEVYNHIQPHQALGYLTPHQFATSWQHHREEVMCH